MTFARFFALVAVLSIVGCHLEIARTSTWTYAQLLHNADVGNVHEVDFWSDSNEAIAVDRAGNKHDVTLPGDTAKLRQILESHGVMEHTISTIYCC